MKTNLFNMKISSEFRLRTKIRSSPNSCYRFVVCCCALVGKGDKWLSCKGFKSWSYFVPQKCEISLFKPKARCFCLFSVEKTPHDHANPRWRRNCLRSRPDNWLEISWILENRRNKDWKRPLLGFCTLTERHVRKVGAWPSEPEPTRVMSISESNHFQYRPDLSTEMRSIEYRDGIIMNNDS